MDKRGTWDGELQIDAGTDRTRMFWEVFAQNWEKEDAGLHHVWGYPGYDATHGAGLYRVAERGELDERLGWNWGIKEMVGEMCGSREGWRAVARFMGRIMGRKKVKEREIEERGPGRVGGGRVSMGWVS